MQFVPRSSNVDTAVWMHYMGANKMYGEKAWRQLHKNAASNINKSTKQQLYGHLPPITKTIQVRQARHVGHCWRSRDELISDVLPWTPSHGRAKAGQPATIYIQQVCADMGCDLEDLSEAMDNSKRWRERVRDIYADGATWWWYIANQTTLLTLFFLWNLEFKVM